MRVMRPVDFLGGFHSVFSDLLLSSPTTSETADCQSWSVQVPARLLSKYRQRYIGGITSLLSGISAEDYVIERTSYVLIFY